MSHRAVIRRLSAREMDEKIDDLSDVLIDCVEGGASVGFLRPLTRRRSGAFWLAVKDKVAAGAVELLIAEIADFLAGAVQVAEASYENQPHRADVSKLLVHRRARRQGVGRALMEAAEDAALKAGKTLLVLDTAGSEAQRLYERLNWTVAGQVPDYALWPDGRLCDTTIMYKRLAGAAAGSNLP